MNNIQCSGYEGQNAAPPDMWIKICNVTEDVERKCVKWEKIRKRLVYKERKWVRHLK